jgi:cell division protein FtsL
MLAFIIFLVLGTIIIFLYRKILQHRAAIRRLEKRLRRR